MKNELLVARLFTGRRLRRTAFALGLCAAVVGALTVSAPAVADPPSPFVGIWYNSNSNTNHIVRIQIAGAPGALGVHVFGKCHPTPCDWHTVPLTTYGNSISDPILSQKYGTALYNFGFETTLMTFELVNANTMMVDSYTQFHDHSGRQSYHVREQFRRLLFLQPGVPPEAELQP